MVLIIGFFVLSLLSGVSGQLVGTYQQEIHPKLTWQRCTRSGGCVTQPNGAVVIDANWRWVHLANGYTNCYMGT